MKLLFYWIFQNAFAAPYFPSETPGIEHVTLPTWPSLMMLEKGLWLALVIVLFSWVLKPSKEFDSEKRRRGTLRIAGSLVGILVLLQIYLALT